MRPCVYYSIDDALYDMNIRMTLSKFFKYSFDQRCKIQYGGSIIDGYLSKNGDLYY